MNTTAIAILLVLVLGIGVYIGVNSLSQQYAVSPSGSLAGQTVCAPDHTTVRSGQTVKFTASVPEGTAYYWSAPDAAASFVISGPLTAQYARAGTKTVYLFTISGDRWYRIACTVQVR